MRIGLLGEDTTHDAVLRGLGRRWCPGATLDTGVFRGKTRQRRRRELADELQRLMCTLRCDCVVILLDADNRKWSEAVADEKGKVPERYRDLSLVKIGAPERNIECWLSAAVEDFCAQTGADETEVRRARADDPKGLTQTALQRAAGTRSVAVQAFTEDYVRGAPLAHWLGMACFDAFYRDCRELAQAQGCPDLPNEADAKTRGAT